jgi:hypothetical protein
LGPWAKANYCRAVTKSPRGTSANILKDKESTDIEAAGKTRERETNAPDQFKGYTHKTSGFKTSGFKTSGFKTSGFKTSGLQNVRFTKRQVSKRLVSKCPVFKFDILIKQEV